MRVWAGGEKKGEISTWDFLGSFKASSNDGGGKTVGRLLSF